MDNIILSQTTDDTIWVHQENNPICTETKIDKTKTEQENYMAALQFFFQVAE